MASSPARRPNFLFILADDLGYADLSCYGRDDYETPALDGLAAQGLRLTHAYANSAVCTASRVAIITGRYQYRLPIGLEEPLVDRDVGLQPDVFTLPSLLQQAGYATALVGKWHLGRLPKFGPLKSGYQHYWGFRTGAVDYFTHINDIAGHDLWDHDSQTTANGYLTDLLGDRAVLQLGEFAQQDRPFFLSLHFSAPHWPWQDADDVAESRRLKESKLPLRSYDAGDAATYGRMVQRMDWQIGRVLAELRRLRLDSNTVVVFTSDNGGERFSKMWPFSGRKTELREGGIRVPCIVRWPGLTRPGSSSDGIAMHMDWAATFTPAAGMDGLGPDAFDGVDLRPVLGGAPSADRTVFWRYNNRSQRATRRGRWKYLKMNDDEFLFDVIADPLEQANWKARDASRFADLKSTWELWNQTMLPIDSASFTH